jgi:hypothetical protein
VKKERLIGHIALIGAVLGSMLIALNIGWNFVGYIFFTASSIASVALLKKAVGGLRSLLYTNIYFVCINIVGLVRYFG